MGYEKDYCDYETCVALRELGYNAPQRLIPDYFGVFEEPQYDEKIHLYDAQKWLRREKGIEIVVHSFDYVGEPYFADIHMYREVRCVCSYADSYEEALSEGVREAVKILKEK